MSDDQADPDFLALSQRARDCIDRAYDRAVRRQTGGSRKRRKLNPARQGDGSEGAGYADSAGGFTPEDEGEGGGFIADEEDAGGLIPDDGGGGFIPDDDAAGGFIPDDEDAGGFVADQADEPKATSTSVTPSRSNNTPKIPLTRVPALLSQLNLPADDDVLNVFRASATGWADEDGEAAGASRRRRPMEEEEDRDSKLGVERKDFRAVCAALLGGDEGDLPLSEEGHDGEDVDMERRAVDGDDNLLGPDRRRQRPAARMSPPGTDDDNDDEDGDGFEPTMSEGSSLSSLSSDSEYGASRKRTKASLATSKGKGTSSKKSKGKGKARATGTETDASVATTPRRKGKSKKEALVAEDGPIKLNTRQKEMVRTLWEMLKPPQTEQLQGGGRGRRGGGGNPNVLGREEVKGWVRQLGEMWTEDEITDMVSLFSTQHEKRGLSFEDFGQVMVRGRIV